MKRRPGIFNTKNVLWLQINENEIIQKSTYQTVNERS